MIAYKLFKVKKDGLHTLYIDTNAPLPMNELLVAKEGEKTERGKVKSKLGELAFRPGWHCCIVPLADHIGTKQPNGELYQAKDTVWCEVEIVGSIDYTPIAKEQHKSAKFQCLKIIPQNGYYFFQTNPKAKIQWIICGEIIINRILTPEEVNSICRDYGVEPQPLSEF